MEVLPLAEGGPFQNMLVLFQRLGVWACSVDSACASTLEIFTDLENSVHTIIYHASTLLTRNDISRIIVIFLVLLTLYYWLFIIYI